MSFPSVECSRDGRCKRSAGRNRLASGAGVRQARWADVSDAVTTDVAGAPCVVLRLKNGGATTIPVEVLAVDRDTFVRDIQTQLKKHGKAR